MKKLIIICIVSLLAINLSAQDSITKTIKAKAFQEKVKTLDDALILDCSSIEAHLKEHIEGAILIATSEMMNNILSEVPKETPLLIYCQHGKRSKLAMKKIKKLGFKEIYQLKKGLSAWKSKGLPTTKN